MNEYIGQQFGSYRLTRFLGSGGFANVYLGEHVYLGSLAAVKVLQMNIGVNDEPMFLQEARTLAELNHPHIVRVWDYGIHEKVPFLVMDYAPNGSISQHYPKRSVLPLVDILKYVLHIASALEYAHQKKLVHCDLKPENVLLGAKKQALLADFGTAFIFEPRRTEQKILGTVTYMAPEQLQGKAQFATDQYALGVMIYEWLTGTPPFSGKNFAEIAFKHLQEQPVPPSQKTRVALPGVEQVVMTALAKDPLNRFRSIKAFAVAFEHACKEIVKDYVTTELSSSTRPLTSVEVSQVDKNVATAIGFAARPIIQLDRTELAVIAPVADKVVQTPTLDSKISHNISRRSLLIGAAMGLLVGVVTGGGAVILLPPLINRGPDVVYRNHTAPVYAVAWSPDGRYLVSGSFDKTAQVWDPTTAQNYSVYHKHHQSINSLSWLPNDGTRVVSGSADKTVQIWHPTLAKEELTYNGHTDNVRGVSWSPNELYIASCGDDATVQIWNASTAAPIQTYQEHRGRVWAVSWSPDSRYVATGGVDTTVRVWEAQTGQLLYVYTGHNRAVKATAWSPDGIHVASASDDQTAHVWNFSDGKLITVHRGHTNILFTLAWSPDGNYIATGGADTTVRVWNSRNGRLVYEYSGHSQIVYNLCWSPTGKSIASASGDQTIRVWPVPI